MVYTAAYAREGDIKGVGTTLAGVIPGHGGTRAWKAAYKANGMDLTRVELKEGAGVIARARCNVKTLHGRNVMALPKAEGAALDGVDAIAAGSVQTGIVATRGSSEDVWPGWGTW